MGQRWRDVFPLLEQGEDLLVVQDRLFGQAVCTCRGERLLDAVLQTRVCRNGVYGISSQDIPDFFLGIGVFQDRTKGCVQFDFRIHF